MGESIAGRPTDSERREVRWIPLGDLQLDPQNPRLEDGHEDNQQAQLIATLAKDYDLSEIGQSIADHGYFSEEPLVAVPAAANKFTIVEGNRRLASLKLLADPSLAPEHYREIWRNISDSRKIIVNEVPVLVYEQRSQITPYLGYRHITGVLPWEPYQKAKYISALVEKEGLTFSEIARSIGSKAPTVRDHYVTYTMLRQARDEFNLDTSNAQEAFGVLRRSLSNPSIRSYGGLDIEKSEEELAKPINGDHKDQLKELLSYMFGDEDNDPVIKESRDLTRLGVVLAKVETAEVLRRTRNLVHAFELAGGEEALLIESLNSATSAVERSLGLGQRHRSSKGAQRAASRLRAAVRRLDEVFPPGEPA